MDIITIDEIRGVLKDCMRVTQYTDVSLSRVEGQSLLTVRFLVLLHGHLLKSTFALEV